MSFQLMKEKVIDAGLCTKCGACARNCRHIIMQTSEDDPKGIPVLKGKCIMTTPRGMHCGACYNGCPVVIRKKKKEKDESFFTLREKVLNLIRQKAPITIPELSQLLNESTIDVRFETLRLAQLGKIQMKLEEGKRDPIFLSI